MGQVEEWTLARCEAILEEMLGREGALALMGVITAALAVERERDDKALAAERERNDKALAVLRTQIKAEQARADRNDWIRMGTFVVSVAAIVFTAIRALHP